jgi:hypothetical protein
MATDKSSANVLRIVDSMLLVYNPDKSLTKKEWSTLAVALEKAGRQA